MAVAQPTPTRKQVEHLAPGTNLAITHDLKTEAVIVQMYDQAGKLISDGEVHVMGENQINVSARGSIQDMVTVVIIG